MFYNLFELSRVILFCYLTVTFFFKNYTNSQRIIYIVVFECIILSITAQSIDHACTIFITTVAFVNLRIIFSSPSSIVHIFPPHCSHFPATVLQLLELLRVTRQSADLPLILGYQRLRHIEDCVQVDVPKQETFV